MISDSRLAYVNIYKCVWCVVWKARWPVGLGGPVKSLWSCDQRDGGRVDVCSVCVCLSMCRSAYPCGQGDGGRVDVCSVCVCVGVWVCAGQHIPIPTTMLASLSQSRTFPRWNKKCFNFWIFISMIKSKNKLTRTYWGSSELHHITSQSKPFYSSVIMMTLYQYKMMK